MNLLDVVIIVLVVAAGIQGLRLGAAIQLFSYGSFWLGLFLGALLAPQAAALVSNPAGKAFVSLVVMFGLAGILFGVGRLAGVHLSRLIHKAKLGVPDAGLGAAIAVVASLVAVWLIASIVVNSSARWLTSEVQGSAVIRGIDEVLPPAPSVFSRIQSLINTEGWPQVFAGLAPAPAGPVALPGPVQVQRAVSADGPSIVKIEGVGCGKTNYGSGFVVAPGLVVTNAHVVAGVDQPRALDALGSHATVPVYFDPSFDLAVLHVRGLTDPPLHLASATVGRGTQVAILGYPEGGPFNAVPAGVLQEFEAQGRDIYGQGLTLRAVYELQGVVLPGNSGGPLVGPDGTVVGVVFARSSTSPDMGYALTSPGVISRVNQAEASSTPASTGPCTS